jgi:uncharacterized protein
MSFYDRIRHARAREAAAADPVPWDVERLHAYKYCLLVTYRRNGEAVPTPVWFGVGDGRVYVRTGPGLAKLKRIRHDSRARVAPCSVRGRPLGPPMEGVARILEAGEDKQRAEGAITGHYGLGRRLYEVFSSEAEHGVYVEVSPST